MNQSFHHDQNCQLEELDPLEDLLNHQRINSKSENTCMTQPHIYVIQIETMVAQDAFDIFNTREHVIIVVLLILKEKVKKCSQLLIQGEGKKKTKSLLSKMTHIGQPFEPTASNFRIRTIPSFHSFLSFLKQHFLMTFQRD